MASPQIENGYTKIANELLDEYIHICRLLSPYECAVWLCILRKTYGFNKKYDRISLSQLEELTGVLSCHVARTKKKLLAKNMIKIGKDGISIQKNYHTWVLPKQAVPKQVIGTTQTGNLPLPKQVYTKERTKETNTKERDTGGGVSLGKANPNRELILGFAASFKERFGREYTILWGKDGMIMKDLLKQHRKEELLRLINAFFKSKDSFVCGSSYTIGVFKSVINKLQVELARQENPPAYQGFGADAVRILKERDGVKT